MTIDSLKDLKKLIQLCRQQGVQCIKVDNIELALGVEPAKAPKALRAASSIMNDLPIEAQAQITTDELSEEQMLMWSAAGAEQ